jgi:DnaJ-class molecular chaperone
MNGSDIEVRFTARPKFDECSLCAGTGLVYYPNRGHDVCAVCSGDGKFRPKCAACKGIGKVVGVRRTPLKAIIGLGHQERCAVNCGGCHGSGYATEWPRV